MANWRDWVALATAALGLFLGALITELHLAFAGARERRRALNVLLFDLLEIRLDLKASNPRLLTDVLRKVMHKKFGTDAVRVLDQPEIATILSSTQKELQRTDRFKLAERFQSALGTLVPHDPILAYRLAGNDRLASVEEAVQKYYGKIAQHPDIAADPAAHRILGVMEETTAAALIDEVSKDLASEIGLIARARNWWPVRFWTPCAVTRALRKQDAKPSPAHEQQLEALFDRILSQVASALAAPGSTDTGDSQLKGHIPQE